MFKRFAAAVVLGGLLSSFSVVHAAEGKSAIPPVLKFAQENGGMEVIKDFPAVAGLTGWLVKDTRADRDLIVYTTKDGEYMLAGIVLDKTGKNYTSTYAAEYAPAPDYTAAYNALNEAPSVLVGSEKAKAEVVVVFDANCTYCKLLHQMLTPSVEAGELRVRYVPVAILGGNSAERGAGILKSSTPKTALTSESAVSNDKETIAKVQANTAIMKKYKFNGTPVVLYKGSINGNETLFAAPGVPPMKEFFQRLGISGQMDKLLKDPKLAQYLK